MYPSRIVLFAAVITAFAAAPGFTREESLDDMFSRLLATFQTSSKTETLVCDNRCIVMIDDERHLLDIDEEYIDPEDPCNYFVCKNNGLIPMIRECNEIDTCTNGEPPFVPPGQCCPICGGGPRTPDEFVEWSEWFDCTKTCGRGSTRARERKCIQTPEGVLIECRGRTVEVEDCEFNECPEPCLWKYGEFGECSVTCGTGIRERFPEITQHASNGGQDCPNFVHMRVPDQETCKKEDCPECPGDKKLCTIMNHKNYNKCIDDKDGDCVKDPKDNCETTKNTDQNDEDGDGVGDVCDNCPFAQNPLQQNSDNDTNGNACDGDDDNDGIDDDNDNCSTIKNGNQVDGDDDGVGDACDNCPNLKNENQGDADGDNVGNKCDNCKYVPNPDQEENANDIYGRENCRGTASINDNSLAAEIMEKLLELYYSN